MPTLDDLLIFQQCEQKYYYACVEGLKPRYPEPKHLLRDMLTQYTDHLLTHIGDEPDWASVLSCCEDDVWSEYHEQIERTATAHRLFGNEEKAAQIEALLPTARSIMDHYWQIRGEQDITDSSVIDPLTVEGHSITTENDGERVILWEHRITTDRPDAVNGPDLRDHRLFALAAQVPEITTLRLNYIRPELPHIPAVNKGGTISRNISVTTWPTYASVVLQNGGRLEDYDDMRQKLEGRETSYFFPRIDIELDRGAIERIAANYQNVQKMIVSEIETIQLGMEPAIRHLSHYCESCPYQQLCQDWLHHGDDRLNIGQFTTAEERDAISS